MTRFAVGADRIDGKEQLYINTVSSVLQSKGHTITKLGVGPSVVQRHGQSGGQGETAIFIVGGSDISTYYDFVTGIKNGYYHYDFCIFAFASWTATTWITCSELKTRTLPIAHDAGGFTTISMRKQLENKYTADQYFKENNKYIDYVCGDSAEELGKKIAGGKYSGEEDTGKENSSSSISEVIKELISYWDGEVECRVENDTVYINKIHDPVEVAEYEIREGVNISLENISVSDYNPETTNKLIVHWNGGEDIVFTDEYLINRFGEKLQEMDAVKKVSATKNKESETSIDEIPVETLDEANEFANIEWAKIKRDDGHIVELNIIPGVWEQGKWYKVYIPTYNIDMYMYCTKVSNSDSSSSKWGVNLTLVDYPPSFGKYKKPEEDTESDADEE